MAQNIEQMKFENQPKIAMLSSSAGKLNLAGKDTSHDWAINLIGAKNIAKHQGFRLVEPETFLALNPDIIFIASCIKTESNSSSLSHFKLINDEISRNDFRSAKVLLFIKISPSD